jgi:hypothetical protein
MVAGVEIPIAGTNAAPVSAGNKAEQQAGQTSTSFRTGRSWHFAKNIGATAGTMFAAGWYLGAPRTVKAATVVLGGLTAALYTLSLPKFFAIFTLANQSGTLRHAL